MHHKLVNINGQVCRMSCCNSKMSLFKFYLIISCSPTGDYNQLILLNWNLLVGRILCRRHLRPLKCQWGKVLCNLSSIVTFCSNSLCAVARWRWWSGARGGLGRADGGAGERAPLHRAGGAHGRRVPRDSGAHTRRGSHSLGRQQLREEGLSGQSFNNVKMNFIMLAIYIWLQNFVL